MSTSYSGRCEKQNKNILDPVGGEFQSSAVRTPSELNETRRADSMPVHSEARTRISWWAKTAPRARDTRHHPAVVLTARRPEIRRLEAANAPVAQRPNPPGVVPMAKESDWGGRVGRVMAVGTARFCVLFQGPRGRVRCVDRCGNFHTR